MTRREFLQKSSLLAFAVSIGVHEVLAFGAAHDDPTCKTTNDILGPYYRPNAPERSQLRLPTDTTGLIRVSGRLFSGCDTPLRNAKLEIWHASAAGEYDLSPTFHYYATVPVGANGSYEYETRMPGQYLNGDQYRPSHIHYRVRAPHHHELISQIYFEGDPYLADDPWAGSPKAIHRILAVTPGDNGIHEIQFDVNLEKSR